MGKLEPVVVDPASNWPLFAEKARQLLTKDKVAVTFGCWTSVSRKSGAGVQRNSTACSSARAVRRRELEKNVFYTGARPASRYPGGRMPDEQGTAARLTLRAARHRLRLSAHDQQILRAFHQKSRASPR